MNSCSLLIVVFILLKPQKSLEIIAYTLQQLAREKN